MYEIRHVCDVRNFARSRWPQFNGPILAELLRDAEIGYEHLPECGGKIKAPPKELAFGIERIIEISSEVATVMMCSESYPLTGHKIPRANCHRVGMIAPILKAQCSADIVHIMPDGSAKRFDETTIPSIW